MSKWIFFTFGLLVGVMGAAIYPNFFVKSKQASDLECALAEVVCDRLSSFPKEWNMENIAYVMQGLDDGSVGHMDRTKREEILIDVLAEAEHGIAIKNLEEAESYIRDIKSNIEVITVVPEKVFVETLKKGDGSCVSSEDIISVRFKQFDLDDSLIKTTKDTVNQIHLSRMIKGFKLGMDGAKVGEIRKLYIHPDYGFGKIGRSIKANHLLIYEVEVLEKHESTALGKT